MRLKIASFANCCGIQIIHNFGNTSANGPPYTVTETSEAISDLIRNGYSDQLHPAQGPAYVYDFSMQLIALNSHQHKKLGKMLIKKGFKLIDEGWNKNHQNMNYLYSLHLEKGKKTYKLK